MPNYEIMIKTTDDPRGLQNATEETVKLTDAMGKLLERAKKKEEFAAAKEELAKMTTEEKEAALAAFQLAKANETVATGLTDVERAVAGTRSTIGGLNTDIQFMGKNVGSAADFLSGLGVNIPISPMQLFGEAALAAGNFVKDSIDSYTAWVLEVDRIATYTGMATEETSRLLEVGEDLRIESKTIEMAMKNMVEKGITPSIGGIMQLSDRYLSLNSEQERAKFLNDNFGRSGVEMARLLELGSVKIRAMTEDVAKSMVVTGDARDEVEAYNLAVLNLTESWDAFKFSLSKGVIPSLTELLKLISDPSWEQFWQFYYTINDMAWPGVFPGPKEAETKSNRGNIYDDSKAVNPGDPNYKPPVYTSRATGGPVEAGQLYSINENRPWTGPEYFLAPTNGVIIPAGSPSGGNQGDRPIEININFTSAVSLANRLEAEEVLVPYIKAALRRI